MLLISYVFTFMFLRIIVLLFQKVNKVVCVMWSHPIIYCRWLIDDAGRRGGELAGRDNEH